MDEKAKEARREYYRAYNAAHPEIKRAQNQRYWARRAEKLKAEKDRQKEKQNAKNAND